MLLEAGVRAVGPLAVRAFDYLLGRWDAAGFGDLREFSILWDARVISSTAKPNTSEFTWDGLLYPLILRTN